MCAGPRVAALEALAFEVREAGTGDEALRLLEQVPGISLLFSDVNMPGSLNGLDLVGISLKQKWPEIYVLLTSGVSQ